MAKKIDSSLVSFKPKDVYIEDGMACFSSAAKQSKNCLKKVFKMLPTSTDFNTIKGTTNLGLSHRQVAKARRTYAKMPSLAIVVANFVHKA